eukprot:TRINITY_DN1550_c0_g3_i1.p1 TRINITY_DN1550_c0_g3~~TRINITY_DN1550_c0_g3_i1.p1  ORF type:complete len:308 (+),score=85.60 TRINITY_DN1550_c0_g3_i1:82-924(+)
MDLHVHKIITEIAQLLSTTVRVLHPERNAELDKHKIHKLSHQNHPIARWMRVCKPNWDWSVSMAGALHDEWKRRYKHPEDKVHKSYEVVKYLAQHPPTNFETKSDVRSEFLPCVGGDENIVPGDTEASYRNYYMSSQKQRIASWKYSERPDWYVVDPEHFGKAFEERKAAREEKKARRMGAIKDEKIPVKQERRVKKLEPKEEEFKEEPEVKRERRGRKSEPKIKEEKIKREPKIKKEEEEEEEEEEEIKPTRKRILTRSMKAEAEAEAKKKSPKKPRVK